MRESATTAAKAVRYDLSFTSGLSMEFGNPSYAFPRLEELSRSWMHNQQTDFFYLPVRQEIYEIITDIGEFLVARASVVHSGKNQAVCRCEVYVSDKGAESLCATALGTIARIGHSSDSKA